MARDFQIHGEAMVTVKSRSDSLIGSLTQLGLSADPVQVTEEYRHKDITLDAAGGSATDGIPVDKQWMLSRCFITINFIHFDYAVIEECLRLGAGFPSVIGQVQRAGTRLGAGVPRFTPPNCYIGLNIAAPINNKPYRFLAATLTGRPMVLPLGTEKSIVQTTWEAIPYTIDPWGSGLGMTNVVVYDHTPDT